MRVASSRSSPLLNPNCAGPPGQALSSKLEFCQPAGAAEATSRYFHTDPRTIRTEFVAGGALAVRTKYRLLGLPSEAPLGVCNVASSKVSAAILIVGAVNNVDAWPLARVRTPLVRTPPEFSMANCTLTGPGAGL